MACEAAISFFMQRILFLQVRHSPSLHSRDLHSNSHCESSGGTVPTKVPITALLNRSNVPAIPCSLANDPNSWVTVLRADGAAALRCCTRETVEYT